MEVSLKLLLTLLALVALPFLVLVGALIAPIIAAAKS